MFVRVVRIFSKSFQRKLGSNVETKKFASVECDQVALETVNDGREDVAYGYEMSSELLVGQKSHEDLNGLSELTAEIRRGSGHKKVLCIAITSSSSFSTAAKKFRRKGIFSTSITGWERFHTHFPRDLDQRLTE
jgi:hypothetical protein